MSKKCNSPETFLVLVVFLGVFFRKFAKNRKKKIRKCNSPGVTTVQSFAIFCQIFEKMLLKRLSRKCSLIVKVFWKTKRNN